MQAFIDDSGGKGQGPVFILAGLIGPAEEWAAFSDEWQTCLEQAPAIEHFKMHDAAKLKGEFRRWSIRERDEKILALTRIMNRPSFRAIHCTIPDLAGYVRSLRDGGSLRPMCEPYFHPFHMMIMGVCFDLLDRGHKERCEIIFDEQVIFGPRAKLWYPIIQMALEPEDLVVFPSEPTFRNDEDFVPLQAADMLAWLFRRSMSGQSHTFQWIPAALSNVEMSPHSQWLFVSRMEKILAQARAMTITESMREEAKRLLGGAEIGRLRSGDD